MDRVFAGFLQEQLEEGLALAEASDVLDLVPVSPRNFLATFQCRGLVRRPDGQIVETERFVVAINIPEDHLANDHEAAKVLFLVEPANVWHPNVMGPLICIGTVARGTLLVDLLYRIHEVLTYRRWSPPAGGDRGRPLNQEAATWALDNTHRFPTDARSILGRTIDMDVETEAVT